jgi:Phosphoglycerate dehydrogenase and related dehydrogenases
MKVSSCFISVGSLKHIDEIALLDAMVNNKILGASLDLDTVPKQYENSIVY